MKIQPSPTPARPVVSVADTVAVVLPSRLPHLAGFPTTSSGQAGLTPKPAPPKRLRSSQSGPLKRVAPRPLLAAGFPSTCSGQSGLTPKPAADTPAADGELLVQAESAVVASAPDVVSAPDAAPAGTELPAAQLRQIAPADAAASTGRLHTIKDWHPDDQPRERLVQHGATALATSELIAILLRTGTKRLSAVEISRDLLHQTNGKLRDLSRLTVQDLVSQHGIGKVKAVTLVAALELGKRRALETDVDRPLLANSMSTFRVIGPTLCDLPHEECWVLLLNAAKRLVAQERLSTGSVDGTVVDVRSVMACALRHNASSIIMAHNHPSGNLTPSEADHRITQRVKSAGELMQIPLDDHLIVAGHRFYSFHDEKKL